MTSDFTPFDLDRMFIGDASAWFLAEIAVRTMIMYLYAILVVRLLGKRGVGNISPLEYVIVFAMGSAVGDPMFNAEVPLVYGMTVLTIIVMLQRAVLKLTQNGGWIEDFMESTTTLVVDGGMIREKALRHEQLSKRELLMKLRQKGITNVGQVRYALLEPSGELSVFPYDEAAPAGASTLVFERE